MPLTLPSSPLPDSNPELAQEPKIIKSQFGDGYSQRIGEGLNNIARTITLSWANILESQAINFENFCKTVSDGQAWYWTPPGGTQLKWRIIKFKRKIIGAGFSNFSMDIEQVFDP